MWILILACPVLMHIAVATSQVWLASLAIVVLVFSTCWPGLRAGRWRAWLIFVVAITGSISLSQLGYGAALLYGPPVFVLLCMAVFFGRTLMPGQEPIITRFARAIRGDLPAGLHQYTRNLTLTWTLVFIGLAAISAGLALWASTEAWALFTNLFTYLIVGGMFVADHWYRKWFLAEYWHPSFIEFIRGFLKIDYRKF